MDASSLGTLSLAYSRHSPEKELAFAWRSNHFRVTSHSDKHTPISLSVPKVCNFTTNFGSIFLNDVTIFPHELFIVGTAIVDFEVVCDLYSDL